MSQVTTSNLQAAEPRSEAFLRALNIGQLLKADGPVQFGNLSDVSGTQNAGLFDKIFGIVIFQSINNQTRFFRCLNKNPWNAAGDVGLGGTVGWRIRRERTSTFQGTAGSDSTPLPPISHNRAVTVERLPHYLMSRTAITSYADYIQRNAQNQFQISEPFTYQLEIMRQDMQKRIEQLLLAPSTFPAMDNFSVAFSGSTDYTKCSVPREVARTLMPDDRFVVYGRRADEDDDNPYRASDSDSAAVNKAVLQVVRVVDRGGNAPGVVAENVKSGFSASGSFKYDEVIFKRYGTANSDNIEVGTNLTRFTAGSVFVVQFRKVMTSLDDVVSTSGESTITKLPETVHPEAYNLLAVARKDLITGEDLGTGTAEYAAGRTNANKTGGIVLDAGNQDLSVEMLDNALAIMRENGGQPNLIIMDQRTQKAFSRTLQTGIERFTYPEFIKDQQYSTVQSVSTLKGFDYRQDIVAYKNIPIIEVDDAPLSYSVSAAAGSETNPTIKTLGRNVYILDTRSIDVGVMLPTQVIRAGNPILLNALERQVMLIQLMDLRVKVPAYQGKITNLANVEPSTNMFTTPETGFVLRTDEEA